MDARAQVDKARVTTGRPHQPATRTGDQAGTACTVPVLTDPSMTSRHATTATSTTLLPAFLVRGLPADPAAAAAALGLTFAAFGLTRGGAWQADFDLPRG